MKRPIGLFDSGFGGLTVMREVARALPFEDLVYLGDTANLPYGNKSPQAVERFALENSAFLLEQNIKLLIVACHTACSHALHVLQEKLPIPVMGVIAPGLELAAPFQRIAVLGTTSTIESGIYQQKLRLQNPSATIVAVSCPLFVPLVEEGLYNAPAAYLIAQHYLKALQVDAALLACTHYPLLRSILQQTLGPHVLLLEPAQLCAEQVVSRLKALDLLEPSEIPSRHTFYVTDNPEKFHRFGPLFFGDKIEKIEKKGDSVKSLRHAPEKTNFADRR